jgi:hypothetical protein
MVAIGVVLEMVAMLERVAWGGGPVHPVVHRVTFEIVVV